MRKYFLEIIKQQMVTAAANLIPFTLLTITRWRHQCPSCSDVKIPIVIGILITI